MRNRLEGNTIYPGNRNCAVLTKQLPNRLVVASGILWGLLAPPCLYVQAAAPSHIDPHTASGRIAATLRKERGWGYVITPNPPEPEAPVRQKPGQNSGSLLFVNGVPTKHMSLLSVKRLLRGPVGTSVDLQILTTDGIRKNVTFKRQPSEGAAFSSDVADAAWRNISEANRGFESNWQIGSMYTGNDERLNLDVLARARKNLAGRAAQLLFAGQEPEAYQALISAAVTCDSLGDMPAANDYLQLALAHATKQGVVWRHGDGPLGTNKTIEHLLQVGRLLECKKLCELGLAGETIPTDNPYNGYKEQLLWPIQKAYGQSLVELKDKKAPAKLLELFQWEKRRQFMVPGYDDALLLADLLQKVNLAEQSASIFNALNDRISDARASEELDLRGMDCYNSIKYRLAEMQHRNGHADQAISTLNSLRRLWLDKVSLANRQGAEAVALYFPAPSDIDLKLAQLNLETHHAAEAAHYASSAYNLKKTALGSTDPSLKEPLITWAKSLSALGDDRQATNLKIQAGKIPNFTYDSEPTPAEEASMIREAISSLDKSDVAAANKVTQNLYEIYSAEGKGEPYAVYPMNIFCSLLNIARKLSDKHQYLDSQRLLDNLLFSVQSQERTPAVVPFIIIEQAINSDRASKTNQSLWLAIADGPGRPFKLNKVNAGGDGVRALNRQENLRSIADIYLLAGERARAEIILNHARYFQGVRRRAGDFETTESLKADTLLTMEEALVASEQGKFGDAEQLTRGALAICPPEFLIEAAPKTYEFYGDETSERFVESLRSKIERLIESMLLSHNSEAAEKVLTNLFEKSTSAFKSGKSLSVIKLLSKDQDWNKRVSDGALDALMARTLYANGKTAEAFEYVKRDTDNQCIPAQSFFILAGDIARANNKPGDAAHFYSEAAKSGPQVTFSMNAVNPDLTTELLRKAVGLAEQDASFDRTELTNLCLRYGYLLVNNHPAEGREYLKRAYDLLPNGENRKADLLLKISNINDNDSRLGSSKQQGGVNASSHVDALAEAARLAESSGRKDAYRYWIDLAESDATLGDYQKAFEHAEHGISLIVKCSSPIQYHVPIYASNKLWQSLVTHHYYEQAEKIFVDAFHKTNEVDGKDSFAAAQQGAQLVIFYLDNCRDEDALHTLTELESDCPRALEIGRTESALTFLVQSASELVSKKRETTALSIYESLLAADRRTFAADDERIASSLIQLAAMEMVLKKNELSEKHMREAADIFKLYYEHPAAHAQTLRQVELQRLGATVKEENEPQESSNFVSFDPTQTIAERISALQANYKKIRASVPYGANSVSDLDQLLGIAADTQNWTLLAASAADRIEIFERKPDPLAGRQTGCRITNMHRARFYEWVIEANINLQKKAEADAWIKRAAAHATAPSFYDLARLAEFALDCGNVAEASRLALLAESHMDEGDWVYGDLIKVWRKMGRADKAADLEAKVDRLKEQYELNLKDIDKGPFNHVGQ